MNSETSIEGRKIGPDHRPYLICELSGNHNGSLDRALAILEKAKKAGADAFKIQTYTADTITINHQGEDFRIKEGEWSGQTLHELYSRAHTPWEWHQEIFRRGHELGITVFSSPFDHSAVDFLEELGAPAYKIASFEVVDLPLIEKVASTGKPIILSTGMANDVEISEAIDVAERAGCIDLMLLHCVSAYPTPVGESNLKTINYLQEKFGKVVGLSDHTLGTTVSTVAVGVGANVIEKHVTLSREDGGPDAAFSLEPAELTTLVQDCQRAWECLGHKRPHQSVYEMKNQIFRKSIYAVKDIPPGARIGKEDVKVIRPGYGLEPKFIGRVVGAFTSKAISRGTALRWDMLADSE